MGWAGSDEMVRHLELPEGFDFVVVFDYRDLSAPAELLEEIGKYKVRRLAGWSFGVWAASRIFREAAWDRAVAFNGTPRAIDDRCGIPQRAFALTVRGIQTAGTMKFLDRMCGGRLKTYWKYRSTRGLDECVEELTGLGEAYEPEDAEGLWSKAVVGMGDLIFPPENMLRFWQEAGVETEQADDMPHYPLYDPMILKKWLGE